MNYNIDEMDLYRNVDRFFEQYNDIKNNTNRQENTEQQTIWILQIIIKNDESIELLSDHLFGDIAIPLV